MESLQAFIEVEQIDLKSNNISQALQRSNSTNETRGQHRVGEPLHRSNSKLANPSHQYNNFKQKIKSVEYLPNSNSSTILLEGRDTRHRFQDKNYNIKWAGSVPDLKKVFISEYI